MSAIMTQHFWSECLYILSCCIVRFIHMHTCPSDTPKEKRLSRVKSGNWEGQFMSVFFEMMRWSKMVLRSPIKALVVYTVSPFCALHCVWVFSVPKPTILSVNKGIKWRMRFVTHHKLVDEIIVFYGQQLHIRVFVTLICVF